jgi:sugar phosphate isomerase/epimerase
VAPKDAPLDEVKRNCVAALEECCAYAGQHGIFLGLENHGGIVAEPDGLLELVKAVKSPGSASISTPETFTPPIRTRTSPVARRMR